MPTNVEASTHISDQEVEGGVKDHDGLGTARVQDHHELMHEIAGCHELHECWGILTRSKIGLGGGVTCLVHNSYVLQRAKYQGHLFFDFDGTLVRTQCCDLVE